MVSTRLAALTALTLAFAGSVRAANLKAIGAALSQVYKGQQMIQRTFYSGKAVRYASDGSFIKGGKPGSWTVDAVIVCKSVELKSRDLVIEGKRLDYVYSRKQAKMEPFLASKASIEIATDPSTASITSLQEAISKVFLTGRERLIDFVPDYWKPYLEGKNASSKGEKALNDVQPLLEPSGVPRAGPPADSLKKQGINPARVVKFRAPQYSPEGRNLRIQGSDAFYVTIGPGGRVKKITILRPLGVGMDEEAIESILKSKYRPATRKGKPFAARVTVTFSFRLHS